MGIPGSHHETWPFNICCPIPFPKKTWIVIGFGLDCQSILRIGFGIGLTITYLFWIWIGSTIKNGLSNSLFIRHYTTTVSYQMRNLTYDRLDTTCRSFQLCNIWYDTSQCEYRVASVWKKPLFFQAKKHMIDCFSIFSEKLLATFNAERTTCMYINYVFMWMCAFVCLCVCVCVKEREREREKFFKT